MADDIRFEVRPAGNRNDVEVLVFVNGVEMTSRGAGMGMDPYDLFIPVNRLRPRDEAFETPIARCSCGVYGCGSTDVRVSLRGDVVEWEWLIEQPGLERSVFDRSAYERALDALEMDHAWESPERTAGRLVLGGLDRDQLAGFGLRPGFVCNDWRDPTLFQVSLTYNESHQLFLRFPWPNPPSPTRLADHVLAVLGGHPSGWTATWHPFMGDDTAPAIGPNWTRERLP